MLTKAMIWAVIGLGYIWIVPTVFERLYYFIQAESQAVEVPRLGTPKEREEREAE